YTSEMPDGFSFFGDKEVVKQYLAKGLQTDQHVQKVIDLAKVMIVRRNISQNARVSFPIHSQVLALTMEYANNEIVLEVGGGTGEIAAIMAHCARKLYYIDMDPQCVEKFKQRRLELSKSVRDKLKLIEGNCAKILEQHPELEGQVGLAHGKDVIHMCTEEELHEFLTSLKRLLKPGGKAIFTANYIIHALPKNSVIQDPECTTFRAMHIYLNTEVGH